MNLQQTLGRISTALAVLTYKIHSENLAGLFSLNRLAEDIFLPVFRLTFAAPGLRNLNSTVANYPYIDLGDTSTHLAIQVTTERREAKVTETLQNFVEKKYYNQYNRLVMFVLTDHKLRFAPKTKARWKRVCGSHLTFDPASDIITPLQLLPLIQQLTEIQISQVDELIARSIVGEEYIDVSSILTNLSKDQLNYEKKAGKYIPDIFVETRETKNLARVFSHPVLFLRRTIESIARVPIPAWNRFLAKAGLPPLEFPSLNPYQHIQTLTEAAATATQLASALSGFQSVLEAYKETHRGGAPPFNVRPERWYFYEENTYTLQNALGLGLAAQIADLVDELNAAQARVFILTGRAGQGKTNFVCDLAENFLLKHQIPCAYLTGRKISAVQTPDLGDAIQWLLFAGKTSSFEEAARLLSEHAGRTQLPFLLVIDGLNEHRRLPLFAEQLEVFLPTVLNVPHLKVLLTCRSEFFDARFGALATPPLLEHTLLLKANEQRMEDDAHDEMVAGYFKFFKLRRKSVAEQVIITLKRDTLLLRFFCEAYGAKGKPKGYRQPWVGHIYRAEIFEKYLHNKLGTANLFLQQSTPGLDPLVPRKALHRVLQLCVHYMLNQESFAAVPTSIIPGDLNDALFALLDEELILRRDPKGDASLFHPSEETINFTFDELRDFLIAQYLIECVFAADREDFTRTLGRLAPKESQITEGIKRFLFYASRNPHNEPFWEFYRTLPWYQDVYDAEIFNVAPDLHRQEDKTYVLEALKAGGEKAQGYARSLAVRWDSSESPILNLELLLQVITTGSDETYRLLILDTFRTIRGYKDGSSAEAFCVFISKHILPGFAPNRTGPKHALFLFLALLLPVDAGPDLTSAPYSRFRELMESHPDYAIGVLRQSLALKPTGHRASVWRLLSCVPANVARMKDLLIAAQTEAKQAPESSPLSREAQRFLDETARIGRGGKP